MAKFYNPYHFVPVTNAGSTDDLSVSEFPKKTPGHIWHDRYSTARDKDGKPLYFSGRIICCLTTEDPMVIGSTQSKAGEQEFTKVEPFEIEGKPAIPATTLKGLISSTAEAASNSALRVLKNRVLSYTISMRERDLPAGRTYEHFKKISPEKLPFNSKRKYITIAEQLFGFVEQDQESPTNKKQETIALAGRVKFSFGILCPEVSNPYEDSVLLRILGSPHPPQPAFYFKNANNNATGVFLDDLKKAESVPQGRKFYLHKRPQDVAPWATNNKIRNKKLKSQVKPVKANLSFYFHIDFENLSRIEMGLLCYALRPTDAYRHKIGMGKSIGLGKVRIDLVGLFLIDRKQRYQEMDLFNAARYHSAWLSQQANTGSWPDSYASEKRFAAQKSNTYESFEGFREEFRKTMDEDIRTALELIGDPGSTRSYPVHTPQVVGERDLEKDTYRWFVENKRQRGSRYQFLKPITRNTKQLPELDDT